tara:strand:- start:477 stop:1055 length:579 start_codon:yes stop_codon:yes gene_type:complete
MPLGASRFGLLGGVADLGKLELIETQTVSGTPNNVDFINLASNPYNVYFLTATNVQLNSDGFQILLRLSNDNGSSFIGGSSYQFANMRVGTNGAANEYKSSGTSFIGFETYTGSTSAYSANFYIYFYNLLDSSKYSFTTNQTVNSASASGDRAAFGSGVLATAETHNAFRLFGASSKLQTSGTYSLYGIAES